MTVTGLGAGLVRSFVGAKGGFHSDSVIGSGYTPYNTTHTL